MTIMMYFLCWWVIGIISVIVVEYFDPSVEEYTIKYLLQLGAISFLGPIIIVFFIGLWIYDYVLDVVVFTRKVKK